MSLWRRRLGVGAWLTVLAAVLGTAACSRAESEPAASLDDPATRADMARVVEPLRRVLPLTLSERRFAAPEHRAETAAALTELAQAAASVEAHGLGREESFVLLSRSLADQASEIDARFRAGRFEESRFLLRELVDVCAECHARLPSGGDSALGAALYRDVDPDGLDPFEALRFQIATRQFDAALASVETLLADPDLAPARIDLEGALDDYLLVALRVVDDPARARAALARFRDRADQPRFLRATLEVWVASLDALAGLDPEGDLLEQARDLVQRAQSVRRTPADRTGEVFDLAASARLHRWLVTAGGDDPRQPEAYYLLGLVELRRGSAAPLAEGERFLETAIRRDPASPWAESAYALLEDATRVGYSGSGGEHVPPEIERWLGELLGLIEAAEAAAGPQGGAAVGPADADG